MKYLNAYGVDLGQAGYKTKYKGPPVMAAEPKPNAAYEADIIDWREGGADWTIPVRVIDENNNPIVRADWQLALWWPDADKEGNRPAPTNSQQYPVASLYSLEEMLDGIEYRSPEGYVNNDGGPYVMWLDGPDIESPMWRVGWSGNHFYTGPYLRVRRKGGSTPTTPPPVTPPASGNAKSDLLDAISALGEIHLRLRDAAFRLP